jgi:hypothetical protein
VLHHGDYSRSQALSEEALALSQTLGSILSTANVSSNLGLAVLLQGDRSRATQLFKQGLGLFRQVGDITGMSECLEGLALAQAEDAPAQFVQLFALADRQRSSIGAPRPLYLRTAYERYLEAARSRISDEALAAGRAEGLDRTLDQAVADALEGQLPP